MTIWSHEDPVPGTFNDGAFPVDRPVLVRQTMGELIIEDEASGDVLARWPLGTLLPVPDADFPDTMRLKQSDGEGGRLAIFDRAFNEGLTEWWPALRRRLVLDRAALNSAVRVSLGAVVGFGLFFLVLLPTLGQLGAHLVPPTLERRVATVFLRHPDPLLERINIARVCDTDPVAPILDKLVGPLRKATGWPDAIRIRVIDDPLPNAATVAGGEIILFKGMLFFAHDGDELAGILAHEMGHVTRRHAVRNLFVTSLNFFGFDQLLGNFSGQLVVHPVSGLMLTRREGRRAEKEADLSAIRYLDKAGYKVRPLADILDRVGYLQGEKEVSEGWLATHPLSRNRARMIRDAAPPGPRTNVLTPAEFGQLRAVCETRSPKSNAPLAEADPASANNPSSPLEDNAATVDEPAPVEQKAAPEPHDSRPHPESGQNADKAGEDDGKRIDAPAAPSADAGAAPAEEEKKGEETHDAEAPNLGEWDVGGGSD